MNRLTLTSLVIAASAFVPVAGTGAPSQLSLCSISTTGVAFGNYSVFSASPKDSTGTVTYQCTLGINVQVQLGKGSSASFNPRTLKSGANVLNYNLYLDAGHSTIWGDGTSGTSQITETVVALTPRTVTVYGRIPASQDATVGSYSDSVVATIIF